MPLPMATEAGGPPLLRRVTEADGRPLLRRVSQTNHSQLSYEAMRFEPGKQSHCVRFDDDVDLQEFEPQRWVSRKTRTVAM